MVHLPRLALTHLPLSGLWLTTPQTCDIRITSTALPHFCRSNRRDRDDYVTVTPSNSDNPIYFKRVDERSGDIFSSSSDIGSYDFDSIMHPRRDDDLKASLVGTGATTMGLTALGATMADSVTFGRGSALSSGDEIKVETMYGSMCIASAVGGDHACFWTVSAGETLVSIRTNVQSLFSVTVSVADLQRLNSDSYACLESDPTCLQPGWRIRFCYNEGERGFIISVPESPPDNSPFDMVDTNIFKVCVEGVVGVRGICGAAFWFYFASASMVTSRFAQTDSSRVHLLLFLSPSKPRSFASKRSRPIPSP